MENVIELQHIQKSFNGFQIKDFSIHVKKGFVTGFIGGNGAGKSTFLKILSGEIEPSTGRVEISKDQRMSVLKTRS